MFLPPHLIAIVFTLFDRKILDTADAASWGLLIGGLLVGTVAGLIAAKKVKMTSMPEMVALLNGFGGLASLLVGWVEFHFDGVAGIEISLFTKVSVIATILIGGLTFTGSVYAWGKLSGKISGKAKVFGGQKILNASIAIALVLVSVIFCIVVKGKFFVNSPWKLFNLFFCFVPAIVNTGLSPFSNCVKHIISPHNFSYIISYIIRFVYLKGTSHDRKVPSEYKTKLASDTVFLKIVHGFFNIHKCFPPQPVLNLFVIPILSVKGAVLQRLGNMVQFNKLALIQIGNRP